MVFTYCSLIYSFLPFLGVIRVVLLAGIALLASYMMSASNYTNRKVYQNSIVLAWIGFLGSMVMSLLVSYDRGLTLQILEGSFKHFLVFMVAIKIIDTERRLDLFIGVFAGCSILMALNTILNYFVFGSTYDSSFRAMGVESGIFGDPNDLALLFNTSVPLLLYFLFERKRKLISLAGLILVLTAVMLTYSRGGFVGLCAVGAGFFLLSLKRGKGAIPLIVAIALFFWVLAPQDYKDRISTIKDEAGIGEVEKAEPTRLDMWELIIKEGMDRPILGAGAGCSYYVSGLSMRDWHSIHNSFIQAFSEMGMIGLFFYLLLFALPFKQYRRAIKSAHSREMDADSKRFSFIHLSFLAFAVTACFLPQAYSPILFTLLGMSIIQTQLISKKNHSPLI